MILMKRIVIIILLVFASIWAMAQYNPSLHTVTNKAIGIAQATPTDARSYYFDASTFVYRPYANRAEILAYLNLAKYRTGQFSIILDSAGQRWELWFRDGVTDGSLVYKNTIWGEIKGTLSNQTDLQTALNLRLNKSDTAAMLSPYLRTASNGLTKTGRDIALGGTLDQNTTILTSTFGLTIGTVHTDGLTALSLTQTALNVNNSNTVTNKNMNFFIDPLTNGFKLSTHKQTDLTRGVDVIVDTAAIIFNGNSSSEKMRIKNTGAVGIGTNNPLTLFNVNGTGLFNDTLTATTMGTPDSSNRVASTAWVKRQRYGSGGGGSGTVTNVATGLFLSGGPITTTGTIIADSAAMAAYFLRRKDSTLYTTVTRLKDTAAAIRAAFPAAITALTGDGTATGPGSSALTLATVNSNVGSFTNANVTVNAKGLITAASSGTATTNNTNIGSAFRWLNPGTQTIKTVGNGYGIIWDSTSTANTLTPHVDTSIISQTINTRYIAYVDTLGNDATGQVNNPGKPFKTINAALDATAAIFSCVINIGIGTFDSPDSSKMRSNIWFCGSGMPVNNDTVTVVAFYNTVYKPPTKMIGGTILQGTFGIPYDRENIKMSDIGIDVGPDWSAAHSNLEVDGMLCAQLFNPAGGLPSADGKHQLQVNTKPRRGMYWQNINVLLTTPSSDFHAFLVENSEDPVADNIHTCYGFAGIVIKTIRGYFTNLHTKAHVNYHIILKSNDYSFCYGVTVSGFECNWVNSYGQLGTGISLDQNDPGSPGIYWCNVNNGWIGKTSTGMALTGDNMIFNDISIVDVASYGVTIANLYRSQINGVQVRIAGSNDGFNINPGSSLTNTGTIFSNCSAYDIGGDAFEIAGGTDRVDLENFQAGNNTGFGIKAQVGTNLYVGTHSLFNNTGGTISGPILVRAGAVPELGTALQQLRVNAGGTQPEWFTPTSSTTIYTGDGSISSSRTVTSTSSAQLTFASFPYFNIKAGSLRFQNSAATQEYNFSTGTGFPLNIGWTHGGLFDDGIGVSIDTNNNIGLGSTVPTTLPLSATGLTTYVGGGININSGLFKKFAIITTNTTLDLDDNTIYVDATSGNITITLPSVASASSGGVGIVYTIKRIDASINTVTITPNGSDTIDLAATLVLTSLLSRTIQATTSGRWFIN